MNDLPPPLSDNLPSLPGQRLARGVVRMLIGMGHAPLCEFTPVGGLRVDVVSVAPSGEIWVAECKSCRADFAGDRKWQGYLDWCDRFFWATDCDFPVGLLPDGSGLILADAWGAEISRMPSLVRLAPARRAKVLRDIARVSACRLISFTDPLAFAVDG